MEFWAKLAFVGLLLKLICKLAYLNPHQPKIFFFNLLYFSFLFKLKNKISIVNCDFSSKIKHQLLITISIKK